MEKNGFGLSINVEGVGYIDTRHEENLHNLKSFAGRAFRLDAVKSICVYDSEGTARLYLKKTENGVVREER